MSNVLPMNPKLYQSLAIQSNKKPSFVHLRSEVPYEQSSDIIDTDFTIKEGINYAPVRRDRLSPSVTGSVDLKQSKGDKMITAALKILVDFPATNDLVTVKEVSVGLRYLRTGA